MRAACRPNDDLHALVKRHERLHQAFEREVLELVRGGRHLAEAALFDQFVELTARVAFAVNFSASSNPRSANMLSVPL